ncbi:MAG: hypothetical protein ABIQ55_09355 [Gemmatimonadaceae bacterium]
MKKLQQKFYLWLAATFPVFFLLHWNGLFDETYYWALEETGTTQRLAPQVTAALLSAIIIYAALAASFEIMTKLVRPRR